MAAAESGCADTESVLQAGTRNFEDNATRGIASMKTDGADAALVMWCAG
jgi:hypothetical protein